MITRILLSIVVLSPLFINVCHNQNTMIIDERGESFMRVRKHINNTQYIVSYCYENGSCCPAILYRTELSDSLVAVISHEYAAIAPDDRLGEDLWHAVVFNSCRVVVRSSLVFFNKERLLRHDASLDDCLINNAKTVAPFIDCSVLDNTDFDYYILLFHYRYW